VFFFLPSTKANAAETQDNFHSILPHLKGRDHKQGQYGYRVVRPLKRH